MHSATAVASHIYRACLLLYPSAFRLEFGDEMLSDFGSATQDAWRAAGWTGAVACWAHVGGDLLRSVALQWLRSGVPAVVLLSAIWSTTMATLVAQVAQRAPFAGLLPPREPDEDLAILLVGIAVVVVLIAAVIIVTAWFWMVVVRRKQRA